MTGSCLGCNACERGEMVALHDGRKVCSSCEDWRAECEARAVLNMPSKQARQHYLMGYTRPDGRWQKGIKELRGDAALKRLQALIMVLWQARQGGA